MRQHDGELIGQALRRFNKLLVQQGVPFEMRRKMHYSPAGLARRRKRFRKRFKARQATLLAQKAGVQPAASLIEAAAKFWRQTGKP